MADWPWTPDRDARSCWQDWARDLAGWMAAEKIDVSQAIVILPVGAVLAPARAAWAETVGGWLPRIDTIAALASDQAWRWVAPLMPTGSPWPRLTLDPMVDRLQAARALGQEAWGKQWQRRDRRGFEFAMEQVMETAHAWLRRLQAVKPARRAAYAELVREALNPGGAARSADAPGNRERLLLVWAFEWAAATAEAGLPTDALLAQRPSAFVVTTAGRHLSPGTEGQLAMAVMAHLAGQGVPARWVCASVPTPAPEVSSAHVSWPTVRACLDAEDEARQTAAQLLIGINDARAQGKDDPVALIALDRSLVRRVRAMLDGAGALIADETGWRLSTTRAAAALSRLIQAAHPQASTDDLLDWLKSGWVDAGEWLPPHQRLQATGLLEQWCRRHGILSAWSLLDAPTKAGSARRAGQSAGEGVQRTGLADSALALWQWARQVMQALQTCWQSKPVRLKEWLAATQASLEAAGAMPALLADEAGALAWQALRHQPGTEDDEGKQEWAGLCAEARMDGSTFVRWVGQVLEDTTFRPPAPDQVPDVVITPMARAVLRPFSSIVLAGADERQLGALPSASGWLGTRQRAAMDLATPQSQRAAQWDAFELLMSRPNVVCLYRKAQGSEPLERSPWLERWSKLMGQPIAEAPDALVRLELETCGTPRPLPTLAQAAWALPTQLSATTYDALRQCPYRFFATGVLGLREQDELEEGLDRSDFGIWLHEVLRRFHEQRREQLALSTEAEDVQAWMAAADAVCRTQGMDLDGQRPYFLPFKVELQRLATAYVRWLHQHERDSWDVRALETVVERPLAIEDGWQITLHGQLDRIDSRHQAGGWQQFVIDYKTGSHTGLKNKVAQPLEDTQLSFYAALAMPEGELNDASVVTPVGMEAAYLQLDAKAVSAVPHPEVADSAQALLEGIAQDWRRLKLGEPMRAMGEGSACEYCKARGLCRKDNWAPEGGKP